MAFNKKSFQDIYKNMQSDSLDRLPQLTDFQEGSVVRSLFESFSIELATLYEQMQLVYDSAFIDTAIGSNLDRVVAVLGIKRNEPDYATGHVTFERDSGWKEKIVVPVGTYISTKENETEEIAKKVYVTIEEGILDIHDSSLDIRVRAELRGKEMVTGSNNVIVMPRPIVGIKTITNKKPIMFLGKEGETDDELRSRAKQMLIASGRASKSSIENALFGFPGVREVRVNEIFEIYKLTDNSFNNLSGKSSGDEEPEEIVPDEVLKKLKKIREVEYIEKREFENTLLEKIGEIAFDKYGSLIVENSRHFNPGLTEVYVDGLNDDNYSDVKKRIDEVRAAGIYIVLKSAIPVNINLFIKIEVEKQIAAEDQIQLEKDVRDQIISFVDALRLGEDLKFSQLTTKTLNVKGVTDLEDYNIYTYKDFEEYAQGKVTLKRPASEKDKVMTIPALTLISTEIGQKFRIKDDVLFKTGEAEIKDVGIRSIVIGKDGQLYRTGDSITWKKLNYLDVDYEISNEDPAILKRTDYSAIDKKITTNIFEKFKSENVIVAADCRDRLVNIHIKTLPDVDKTDEITEAIENYFSTLVDNQKFDSNNIIDEIKKVGVDKEKYEIKLYQKPYQSEKFTNVFEVDTSIVEKAVANNIFIYNKYIDLSADIDLFYSLTATDEEKKRLRNTVNQLIKDYLETLKPEEDIEFDRIRDIISSIDGIVRFDVDHKRFALFEVDGNKITKIENRIKPDKIKIDKDEKAFLSGNSFYELGGEINIVIPSLTPKDEKEKTKETIKEKIKEYIEKLAPATSINFDEIKGIANNIDEVIEIKINEKKLSLNKIVGEKKDLIKGKITTNGVMINKNEKIFLAESFTIGEESQDISLELNGIINFEQVSLSTDSTGETKAAKDKAQKTEAETKVKNIIRIYLDSLNPGDDIVFANVEKAVKDQMTVSSFNIDSSLLSVKKEEDGVKEELTGRITSTKIKLEKYDKISLADNFIFTATIK